MEQCEEKRSQDATICYAMSDVNNQANCINKTEKDYRKCTGEDGFIPNVSQAGSIGIVVGIFVAVLLIAIAVTLWRFWSIIGPRRAYSPSVDELGDVDVLSFFGRRK